MKVRAAKWAETDGFGDEIALKHARHDNFSSAPPPPPHADLNRINLSLSLHSHTWRASEELKHGKLFSSLSLPSEWIYIYPAQYSIRAASTTNDPFKWEEEGGVGGRRMLSRKSSLSDAFSRSSRLSSLASSSCCSSSSSRWTSSSRPSGGRAMTCSSWWRRLEVPACGVLRRQTRFLFI